jgi:aldose 1-epimerase
VLELQAGDASVAIDEAHGGRLASLRVGGRELLVGPAGPDDGSITWGCYLMAPWPGRLADGQLQWEGRTIQLRRTHGRHAIHGLVSGVPWSVDAAGGSSAELSVSLERDGWPFGGTVRQRMRLEPDRIVLEAEIHAEVAMPAALGWHPWFQRRGEPRLRVDGDAVLEARRMIPTGQLVPVRGTLDLRAGPPLGRRRLDHAYVGVRPPVELTWPDVTLRLETDPWLPTVVVFTPPGAVCVEPETAWPNALALPRPAATAAGARFLAAGERLGGRLVIAWR